MSEQPPPYTQKGFAPPPDPAYPLLPNQPHQSEQPPPGYNQPPSTTVIVAQPIAPILQQFRVQPVHTTCPYCRAQIITSTQYEIGTYPWIICIILICFGCYLGCCLIPFCLDDCKDVIHSCPNCRQVISRYERL